MKNIMKAAIAGVSLLALTACGERATVPSASVGMINGPNGFVGDIINPSTFRLAKCFPWTVGCDKLVIIQAGDAGMLEEMDVLLPKDNLIIGVDVRFTIGLSQNTDVIRSVFDRVTASPTNRANVSAITLTQIYETYGKAVVRNVVRSTLSEYSTAEIAANQAAVSQQLRDDIANALANTPFEVTNFGLASIQFPDVVREAMEATQERVIAIEKAEADAQVQIREAQAALEVARAQRAAEVLQAETIAETNLILSDGVTPELIRYRELQVLESLGGNENVIFFPVEMLGWDGLETAIALTDPQE